MKKKKVIIGIIILAAIVAIFLGVYFANRPKASEGTKAYKLTVVDDQQAEKVYEGKTDAEFLSDLMGELQDAGNFSYEGSESEYGLFITSVNGLTADYDTDGAYWSIYVNGEYGMYGADSQPVEDGDEFTLAYEVYEQ